ncbi:MAG: alpha/beta hydrolase [Gammaproteobacteria bacterium]|nr:alpha/beta hydrolase [Gammaproteobacteria bacterium]MCP4980734.1 alpha/beta hydrolase [Gammaproteobacteria bacterium]
MSKTFIQSAGNGDNVICLHSSMSSSRQWQGLIERMQHSYRVTALDLHGYGKGPQWTGGTMSLLDREVALVADMLDDMPAPIHLVGHSYGGAVAIKAAQIFGSRISSLTLYEPVIFSALYSDPADRAASIEVSRLVEAIRLGYRSGNWLHAAQLFIDYWSGTGTWATIPLPKRHDLSKKVPVVLANFEAVMSEQNSLADLAKLELPTLYLCGLESPASVKAISSLLKQQLPQTVTHSFAGLGHMGPITHSELVNDHIEGFIQQQTAADRQRSYTMAA